MTKKYFFIFLSFAFLFSSCSFCLGQNIAQNSQTPDDFINSSIKLIINLAQKFLAIFKIVFEKIKIVWQKFLKTKAGKFLQPLVDNFKKEFPQKFTRLQKEIIEFFKKIFIWIESVFAR